MDQRANKQEVGREDGSKWFTTVLVGGQSRKELASTGRAASVGSSSRLHAYGKVGAASLTYALARIHVRPI